MQPGMLNVYWNNNEEDWMKNYIHVSLITLKNETLNILSVFLK